MPVGLIEKRTEEAVIVADRFRVMKQVNQELDNQRKKKSKYTLLKNEKDLTDKQQNKLEKFLKPF